jgi:RNA polymerase sigma-70 factor (ECF subfamily)
MQNDQTIRAAIMRMKRGDIGGLAVLVERYQLKAVRTAVLITRDRALAEDVVQNTFLRLYQRIAQFDHTRPFEPYLMRSVVNAAVGACRRDARAFSLDAATGNTEDSPDFGDFLTDTAPAPESEAEAAELRQAIREALQRLTPEQRAVIVARYYLDLSEREMADVLDAPPGTIKWRLHEARRRLGAWLSAFRAPTRNPEHDMVGE